MATIFVSSCRVDASYTAALVARLRDEAFSIRHSPRNLSDGEDARWRGWYESGCREEMQQASIFVTVISYAWDCSTWMQIEGYEALTLMEESKIRKMFFWNPELIQIDAARMPPFLKERLPHDLDELVRVLKTE
jgi:hypothetical protein